MTVLILTANRGFFENFNKKIKFTESTINTCTFKITEAKFKLLKDYVREKGQNIFSVMHWY